MNTIDLTKGAVSFVAGVGASSIAKTIIKNNVQPETTLQKVTVGTASVVIGMMASDAMKPYISTKIDSYTEFWKKAKTQIEEASKEAESK